MHVRRVAGWVAVAVLLAGCSGDSEGNAEEAPTTSSTPTVTSSESAGDEPTPPVMPAVASKPTRAGAVAFTKYFWAVVDYAEASGDTSELKRISGDKCEPCTKGIKHLDELHEAGGEVRSRPRRVGSVLASVRTFPKQEGAVANVEYEVAVPGQVEYFGDDDDRNRELSPGVNQYSFLLGWSSEEQWVVGLWEAR